MHLHSHDQAPMAHQKETGKLHPNGTSTSTMCLVGPPGVGVSLSFLLSILRNDVTNHLKTGKNKEIHPSRSFASDKRQLILKLDTLPEDLEYPPILP